MQPGNTYLIHLLCCFFHTFEVGTYVSNIIVKNIMSSPYNAAPVKVLGVQVKKMVIGLSTNEMISMRRLSDFLTKMPSD